MSEKRSVTHARDLLQRLIDMGPEKLIDAVRHAEEWVATHGPATDSMRGGSSSPTEIDESKEIRSVSRLATKGLEIPKLARRIELDVDLLLSLVERLTTLDMSLYEGEIWCAHHKRHGINEALGSRPRAGNCGWCDDFRRSEGALPPGRVLQARSRGERITGRLIAESMGRKAS